MKKTSFAALALRLCAVLAVAALAASCSGSSDDDDPSPTDSGASEETAAEIDGFFEVDQPVTDSLVAGDDMDLPGEGTITLPRESPGRVDVTVAGASLTASAQESFVQWNPDEELQDEVSQVTIVAETEGPDYVIVRLPSPDESARIYVTGYVDDDTEELAWTPVPTYYDDATGEAIAAVGLGNFASGEAEEQTYKLAALRRNLSTSYRGYIAVAIGGQPFRTEVFFEAVDPLEALEVEFGSEPIQISAVIGLSPTAVREEPLATMTVQSAFGRRGAIRGAPRASRQHKGTDYVATTGTTIFAAGDGVVSTLQWQNENNHSEGAGYYIKIDHGDNEFTSYFHLTDANAPAGCATSAVICCTDLGVCEGVPVTAGQAIASSDNTGHTSGPHLHFEVRDSGVPIDPELIFDERIETTIAMAVDFEVQDATKTRMKLTFGAIEQDDLQAYANEVSIAGLQPGEYTLQFVAIEPGGTFEILGDLPLTITGPFAGISGHDISHRDIEGTNPGGTNYETDKQITETTFSLVAVGEGRLEGQGHVSHILALSESNNNPDCPLYSSIASVEWDVFYEGTFEVLDDGTMSVSFEPTPEFGPDYVKTSVYGGCQASSQTLDGERAPTFSGTLVDGEYYFRTESELREGFTGEDFHEVLIEFSDEE